VARDLPHLPLPQIQAPIARKKHGGGSNTKRTDPGGHATQLIADADEIVRFQRRTRPAAATPALIFKIRLAPKSNLDDNALERFGLTLIARDEDKTLVVFSSQADLRLFRDRVATYGAPTGFAYGEVGNIDGLDPIMPLDRTGRRLAGDPIARDASDVPVDVELWHPGTGAYVRLEELKAIVEAAGGRQTDHHIGTDLLLARCRVDLPLLNVLLGLDIVREVDRIPAPATERLHALGVTTNDLPEILEAPEGATGVLIVDSGITANHPLLAPALGDAQVFPDELGARDGFGAADGNPAGHGTGVAGFATWGSPHQAIANRPMQAQVTLFSARVLDQHGEYDPDQLLEQQLEDAVRYFLDTYPQCRVINLSLGDPRIVFAAGNRQTRLAARLDELAHELQARNVLFTISSGNYFHDPADPADHTADYPDYLLRPAAGLIEPATAALALTVGGLSAGGHPARSSQAPGRRAIGEIEGHPSPFTRTGPGVGNMLKPEFVELAGDLVYDPAAPIKLSEDLGLGLPTTSRDFAPPSGQLLRSVSGTSYAAPAVAHAAALLFNRYPDATPNLIRALLADSAQLPSKRPAPLDAGHDDENVLRTYGYGRPNAERALDSASNDVLLITESSIGLDSFQLFEIPFLPADFLRLKGRRCLSVSLAFDPPTRQTRGDSYLGLSMQFHLFRNTDAHTVAGAFRDWNSAPPAAAEQRLESALGAIPASQKIDFDPGSNVLGKGTLQRGLKHVGSTRWTYDDGPLILAISCLRKWAPPELSAQRYAVVVSLKHSDPTADLHSALQARLQPRQRVRVR
jgi:hypothetical protein